MLQRITLSLAIAASAWVVSVPFLMPMAVANESAKPAVDVVMYTTKTCGYCVRARAWFTEQNVVWDERDIEASETAHAEWKAQGGMGTPLILINGTRFSGFSPEALSAELAKYQ